MNIFILPKQTPTDSSCPSPNVTSPNEQVHSLSLLEVLLERVAELLGELDEVPAPVVERLLAVRAGDVGRHALHRVQQLLYRAGDLPEGGGEHQGVEVKPGVCKLSHFTEGSVQQTATKTNTSETVSSEPFL